MLNAICHIDQAESMIPNLGKGTQLSMLDLKNAYRMVPVHLEDQSLLGTRWQGAVYLDTDCLSAFAQHPKYSQL